MKITSGDELFLVAVAGLDADSDMVERCLYDKKGSIAQASFSVFKNWRNSQTNKQVAYTKMWEGLYKVDRQKFVWEVLKKH